MKWVKWCVEHNLSLVPYVVLFLLVPVYLLYGMVEGVKEWAESFDILTMSVVNESTDRKM